ncbi:unnamed protein product [Microthlaspi erraticum]|uniref:Uncharacterized protein n=1 Tax=Microthlaspi erraticum TaxID=1685480 RepID=A0A6D2KUV0_9BRAS|nr:unnamed protein product [Microthlaspi erraticum]
MVEGESSNARERRLKMQADLERMTQRMEESDAEEYVYSEEESEKEGNGSPSEEGSDETESEEEGEEVNQLVERVSKRVTKMNLWRRLSHKRRRKNSLCTKSTTMPSSPWTSWIPSTHMLTQ